jgi:hypothetical protein
MVMKRVKISALARGDIVLTTTTAKISKVIRFGTKSDISHAMICVQNASVIDATGEGVHARNVQRLFFNDDCALHVLRLKEPPTQAQIEQVCQFVRQAIGSQYSTLEAVRTVFGGSDQWTRKQFCSRLVAQAYDSAGINLVSDPNYCAPADLADSPLLGAVPNATEAVSETEAERWMAHRDLTGAMRDAINAVLEGARAKDERIQTFEDVVPHLINHPENDAYFADLLKSSGYLTAWQLNTERNRWQYEDSYMAELPFDECAEYCKGTLDEESGASRYLINRGAYRSLSFQYKLTSFALFFELYDLLASLHRQRVAVARRWLEANGLIEPADDIVLVPHTPAWFASMEVWDPVKAAQTRYVIDNARRDDICSICGDDPASDYRLQKTFRPPGGPDTLRLCEDCVEIRKGMGDPFEPLAS